MNTCFLVCYNYIFSYIYFSTQNHNSTYTRTFINTKLVKNKTTMQSVRTFAYLVILKTDNNILKIAHFITQHVDEMFKF